MTHQSLEALLCSHCLQELPMNPCLGCLELAGIWALCRDGQQPGNTLQSPVVRATTSTASANGVKHQTSRLYLPQAQTLAYPTTASLTQDPATLCKSTFCQQSLKQKLKLWVPS